MSAPLKQTDLAYALLHAAKVVGLVMDQGMSLDRAIASVSSKDRAAQAQGAVQDLAYFGLRWYGRGAVLTRLLTNKPRLNPASLNDLMALCLALLWDDEHPKYSAHTVVDQAVCAAQANPDWVKAKGLVNACLRSFLRDKANWKTRAEKDVVAATGFPQWWVKKVKAQHPAHWQQLLEQANTHPPMTLRVNQRVCSAAEYAERLAAAGLAATVLGKSTVLLAKPVPVHELPGFEQGHVSVQDLAAQMAAPLMDLKVGMRVLDACAAPGGKTGHMLELADVDVLALDSSQPRLQRVEENIARLARGLGFIPRVVCKAAAAENLDQWWDGKPFDAILLDLPCSGSGVVRRHPDIRWLRRESDVAQLSQIQHKILDTLWSTLAVNGTLLLVTCSVFSEEGPDLAKAFLDRHPDAQALAAPGVVLPQPDPSLDQSYQTSPDGFFYAKFTKKQSI
ncbi:MAG TPA: 16S rRNA (cytosine(967)-C(5))-methyltransferase RsmB [Limnobacter sp.]|uniref:16S rRNA (cytosine(967)-C(5))-methyltransferase RsmB n=1 Tax=Limnobacter sp. TaxID=2003368 RepID=UPI002E331EF1|nr:16S rRNA (cytosine(967)-C(5))-methyltransferase RsmB [Limnobacter sp.]HEX5484929.1 16S rRNA (cytosine(967)-C(5))-methyltransferase RsmB [Limnobacter sp.]